MLTFIVIRYETVKREHIQEHKLLFFKFNNSVEPQPILSYLFPVLYIAMLSLLA